VGNPPPQPGVGNPPPQPGAGNPPPQPGVVNPPPQPGVVNPPPQPGVGNPPPQPGVGNCPTEIFKNMFTVRCNNKLQLFPHENTSWLRPCHEPRHWDGQLQILRAINKLEKEVVSSDLQREMHNAIKRPPKHETFAITN